MERIVYREARLDEYKLIGKVCSDITIEKKSVLQYNSFIRMKELAYGKDHI